MLFSVRGGEAEGRGGTDRRPSRTKGGGKSPSALRGSLRPDEAKEEGLPEEGDAQTKQTAPAAQPRQPPSETGG